MGMHSAMLYQWLGDSAQKVEEHVAFVTKAHELLAGLHKVPRYEKQRHIWLTPLQVSFNSVIFPGKPSRPIWDTSSLPMGRFLEENHHVFKAELEAILNDPRDLYSELRRLDASREHLATPGGWETVRIVRYHN